MTGIRNAKSTVTIECQAFLPGESKGTHRDDAGIEEGHVNRATAGIKQAGLRIV
jgi:hypothetical protein